MKALLETTSSNILLPTSLFAYISTGFSDEYTSKSEVLIVQKARIERKMLLVRMEEKPLTHILSRHTAVEALETTRINKRASEVKNSVTI